MAPVQKDENNKAVLGLKSICVNLESLSARLDEILSIEQEHHKMVCTNITNNKNDIDKALVKLGDIEKKLYQIENN